MCSTVNLPVNWLLIDASHATPTLEITLQERLILFGWSSEVSSNVWERLYITDAEVLLWGYHCSALAILVVKGGLQLNNALWFPRLTQQRNEINSGWAQTLFLCRLVERKSFAVVSVYHMEGTDLHGWMQVWIAQSSCMYKIGLNLVHFLESTLNLTFAPWAVYWNDGMLRLWDSR